MARRERQRGFPGAQLFLFAGIAFLWFIGVIRDQLGRREDRFFATVFLGSGLLFLGMLFVAAAAVGAMLIAFKDEPAAFAASPAFRFARAVATASSTSTWSRWPACS